MQKRRNSHALAMELHLFLHYAIHLIYIESLCSSLVKIAIYPCPSGLLHWFAPWYVKNNSWDILYIMALSFTELSSYPGYFPGVLLTFNGTPRNIQDNLDRYAFMTYQ